MWEYEQITEEECIGEKLPMKLAAMRYHDEELEKINAEKRRNMLPCSDITRMGILDLI